MAEALVQQLFLYCGYEVFHFGMEHTVPGITGQLNKHSDNVSLLIRNTPDFVMKDPATGKVHLVEVKYRANGVFSRKDLPKAYAYPDTWFVLVSSGNIKCISFKELEKGLFISNDSIKDLGTNRIFKLDPVKVSEFAAMSSKLFQGV